LLARVLPPFDFFFFFFLFDFTSLPDNRLSVSLFLPTPAARTILSFAVPVWTKRYSGPRVKGLSNLVCWPLDIHPASVPLPLRGCRASLPLLFILGGTLALYFHLFLSCLQYPGERPSDSLEKKNWKRKKRKKDSGWALHSFHHLKKVI
jgi:hypothetical protein